ncbi:MAG: GAF domain-containing protein [Chloroflexi bacterium]|nr:GAF domain-containing protein [Chloroflexota bacterium]MCC6894798.1 GAF domain-containing protein [Anaerolineae bacterium]
MSRNKNRTRKSNSLQRQMMRRIAPILIIGFVVMTAIAVILYRQNLSSQVAGDLALTLDERAAIVDSFFNKLNADSTYLSRLDVSRELGTVASNTGANRRTQAVQLQAKLADQLLEVANQNATFYNRMQFITVQGSVWVEINNERGFLTSSYPADNNQYAADPFFNAISREVTTYTPLSYNRTEPESPTASLTLFAPIIDRLQNNRTVGFIALEANASNELLNLVKLNESAAQQSWYLVSSNGILLETGRPLAELDAPLSQLVRDNPNGFRLADLTDGIAASRVVPAYGMPDMPWTLLLADRGNAGIAAGINGMALIAVVGTLACVAALYLISRVINKWLLPLSATRALAYNLAAGQANDTLPPMAHNDELGQLTDSFKHISRRMTDLSAELEENIQTNQRRLQLAADINREMNTLGERDAIFERVIERVCDSFKLYHGQIFLLDDIGLNAYLAYSRGLIGKRLVEQGYPVQVGFDSPVGKVTAFGRPVIISDTVNPGDVPYIANPALPETRAQIVVALMAGGQIIGALDLHNNNPRLFSNEEVAVLQLITDQLGLTLQTMRQVSQYQSRIEQEDSLNRRLTRSAWSETEERFELAESYQYNLIDVQQNLKPVEDITALSAPITIRGEVIGTLAAAAPEGMPFTIGDHAVLRAVADRVGLAIEGARLFQETQSSLTITSVLYQLSRMLNEATELTDVVKAVIQAVTSDAASGQIWIFEESTTETDSPWLQLAADWYADEHTIRTGGELQMNIEDSPFLASLRDMQVKVITDTARDNRLDSELKGTLRLLDARAAIFIPFSVRGQWRGILTLLFTDARQFTESDGRIYTALIDQAGVAIDNRLLIRQTELTLNQIERLYAASRHINTSQTAIELIRAVQAANPEINMRYELGLLEGQLDPSGWPTLVRIVARAEDGRAVVADSLQALVVPEDSPLRKRDTQSVDILGGHTHIFPLFSANQPIAMLYVHSPRNYVISAEDYEIYKALSGQISTVLENQRLLQQTSSALDETRRLYTASRAITSAQDVAAVYAAASEHLAQSAQLSRMWVLLAGPTASLSAAYFDVAYMWERQPLADSPVREGLRLNAEALPVSALIAEADDTVYFADLNVELPHANPVQQALRSWGAVSGVVIPMQTQRQWLGAVVCVSDAPMAFDEQFVRFIRAVSDQVAIAVENRMLFDEAQAEAQRALALAEVGQLANQVSADFEQNISQVFERVAEPAGYDRWLLILNNNDDANVLDTVSSFNAVDAEAFSPTGYNLQSSEHSIVDALRTRQMIVVNDPTGYPAFADKQDGLTTAVGKHIVTPIYTSDQTAGALLVGRSLESRDMDEADEQLVRTLAAQVAVAIENRRLFHAAEQEREYLRSILETMPTGIVVLDPHTLKPIQANAQAEQLLGKPINYSAPFNVADYNLIRTGTNVHYPEAELPINIAAASGIAAFGDDIAVVNDDFQNDLLLNAAPIYDARGNVTSIIAAFQDISNLRGLENTLQNSLREQISLYEATRSLSEAPSLEDALDAAIAQLYMIDPMDGYIVLLDETTGALKPVRGLLSPEQFNLPQDLFRSEMLMISNMHAQTDITPEQQQEFIDQGIESLAVIPMRTRDILQGWIVVLYNRTLDFSNDNERFLSTLADNAAVALDNRNLQVRTEASFEEATILYETSRTLANATSPQQIVDAVINKLRVPNANQIFMALPATETNSNDLVVVSNWQADSQMGINLLGVTLNPDQFPAWRQVSTPTLLTIDDVSLEEDLSELERMGLESTDARSLAVIPLKSANRSLGVIWIASSQPFTHTERDRRIFQSFAEQASLSMEATRLLEQTDRRARQLSISAEVSQIANSILDLNVLLPRLVDLIRDAFHYDHVQIFLMDSKDQFAELRASTGEPGRQLLAINHKLAKGSKSVIGQVTTTGHPVVALDTADAHVVHRPNPYLPLTRSEMALPIIVKGRIAGALDVQSNTPNAFGDDDVTVLTTLANQISVALDNARLFEQAENRAREMGFLFNVTTTASASGDKTLGESLQDVATLVRESLNALNASMYLSESYTDQYGESYTLLRAAALSGSDQPLSELSEILVGNSDNALSLVAVNGEPRIFANLEEEPSYIPISTEAKSAIAVPMIFGYRTIGIIALEDSGIGAFTAETLNLMGALTNSLSSIVQNTRLLEQVQRSNEQLRELDRLKSDFLANMSHELRTPLNSIIGFSRVILKGIDGPLTEMQEQDLNTIYNSGTHLLGLINDVLDQAKINSGKMDVHADYFDIKGVVEGVRSIGIGLIKDKPVDMRLEVASGLPKVYGDEFRTRQVLLNLVSNASKFTQEGSITLRVYLEHQKDLGVDMMRVDVLDTGIGIAEKDIPLLFEAFRQVDSSLTRTVGGTGLGLPIAKNLIEMQGGQMLVSSVVNTGSTFSITLPLNPPSAAEEEGGDDEEAAIQQAEKDKRATSLMNAITAPPSPAPMNGKNLNTQQLNPSVVENYEKLQKADKHSTMTMPPMPPTRQILLIEDNPDMVDQLRRALQRESFDIFTASIPLEAEAMASGLRPMLIVMDADFSKGASWDILGRLQERDDTRDIPVIVLALDDSSQRAKAAGAFGFLQRPFTPDQLVDVVRKALAESQTERILIIDDQPESQRIVQQALEEAGKYRIITAHNAQEGISLVARRRPNLVILDLRMPEKDGFEVLEELRNNPETASIPVMIVTAETLNADEQDKLSDVQVIYKTDLSQENYGEFIEGLRDYLN